MDDEVYLIVKSIDLLTVDEAEKLPKNIIAEYGWWWWLQPLGDSSTFAEYVNASGSINYDGDAVYVDSAGIRPVLFIAGLDNLNLPLYTILEVFDEKWIYIGNNKALCEYCLREGRFDKKSSDYKTSEIKRTIDDWLEEQKARFEED